MLLHYASFHTTGAGTTLVLVQPNKQLVEFEFVIEYLIIVQLECLSFRNIIHYLGVMMWHYFSNLNSLIV